MKNKIYRYVMISILFFMTILGIKNVKAETYTGQAIWPSEFISNIYVKKIKPNGSGKYQQMQFIRRSEDNKFVYCLQPYTDIDNNLPYYEVFREDYEKVLNMTEEQWDRISLLAYYGYQYNENGYDHSSNKWYAITQVMIWRTTNPESDIYFTDTLNGNRISSYNDEIAEMESLIQNHYKMPSFESDLTLPLGSSITLTDTNNVLKNYKVSSAENVSATINGNTITITATSIGDGKVNLTKKTTKYETNPILYFSNHSQNVMRVGNYNPVNTNIKLEIFGGKVEINKLDRDTQTNTPQGQGSLKGAIYGVYNTSGDLITKLTTDENGYAISNYLPSVGEFIIKEITPSNGYTLDKNVYRVIVDKNNLLASVNVLEKVITGEIEITKVFASAETQILLPEVGIKFAIYDNNNKLVKEVITDENGKIKITLPFGKYTLKQLTTTPGFEYADDYEFNISEDGQKIKEVISNAEITSKLKLVKIDSDSKKTILYAGATFKIKNVDTGKYVCQKVSYPKQEEICEFTTNELGEFITPNELFSGAYQIEEIVPPYGYKLSADNYTFRIDENSKFIQDDEYGKYILIEFSNSKILGTIEVKKTGEAFNILDNSFYYGSIKLKDVEFSLYAAEDIKTLDGITHYKKGELVKTIKTDSLGIAQFNSLYLGKYIVKETKTLPNYILDTKEYNIELKADDNNVSTITSTLKLSNKLSKGTLEFTKKDLVDGEVIPNTVIEIFTEDDKCIFTGKTDQDGKMVITDLVVGKYYIIEKEPATGYVLTEEKVYFEIKTNGEIVKAEMTNKPIIGSLSFTKVDISTSEPLPNTTIQIFKENDELVYEGITDENGMIVIEELEYGKYYILEKEAPEGYILNEEKMYFEILEDGEIIKATMVNEKVIIEVPITGINDYHVIYIISGVLLLGGIGIIIYAKKKNK